MTFRNIIHTLHLVLGFLSGTVVFLVAVTGCIYAFQEEIQDLTQPYRFVEARQTPMLYPSRLQQLADSVLPGKHIHAVMYQGKDRAAKAIYYSFEEDYYFFVYLDPYTGKILKVKDEEHDFFRLVLDGHFYLWLPPQIGQPVVAVATLVFLVMVLTGLVLWWPRNKHAVKQRFTILWKAKWRRLNYDLHQVPGFYVLLPALIFAVTGLVWGFSWFRDGVYAVASGGKSFEEYHLPAADPAGKTVSLLPAVDRAWLLMAREHPDAEWIEIHPPEDSLSAIAADANPDASTYWKVDYRYFDPYTLKELPVNHIWGRFPGATGAEKLMRLNYDIHTGGIWGFWGKLLAFLASLVVASLPVTGALIWKGRRKNGLKPRMTQKARKTAGMMR